MQDRLRRELYDDRFGTSEIQAKRLSMQQQQQQQQQEQSLQQRHSSCKTDTTLVPMHDSYHESSPCRESKFQEQDSTHI